MNAQPASRLENLSTLLAAMVAVIVSGDMPVFTKPDTITPLRVEFSDVCCGRKWGQLVQHRTSLSPGFLRLFGNTRCMPSTIVDAVAEELATVGCDQATDLTRFRLPPLRGTVVSVAQQFGCDPEFAIECCSQGEDLDREWHKIRDTLLSLRTGALYLPKKILNRYCIDLVVQKALGLSSDYISQVQNGLVEDPRTRAALRAASSAATISARVNRGAYGNRWPKRADIEAALQPFKETQGLVTNG